MFTSLSEFLKHHSALLLGRIAPLCALRRALPARRLAALGATRGLSTGCRTVATLLIPVAAMWGCATSAAGAPGETIDPCSEQADGLRFERMMTGSEWYVRGPGNRRAPIIQWYTRNGRTEQEARAMVVQLEGARVDGQIQTLVGPRVFKIGNEVGMREMFMALDACNGPEPR